MAAYASTVTAVMKRAVKIDSVLGIGMFVGECNITNYNTTLAEITDISKKFKSVLAVVAAVSDNGHLFEWIDATKSFKVVTPTNASDQTPTADIAAAGAAEAATDVDVGSAHFIAYGLI